MPTTILQTKLFIPPANPDHIPRQRLLERLNSGLGTKLTLVTAPPGFGKTSIIAAWVKQTGLPAGWLSLDARDNDPAQSFSHFLAALPDKAVALLTPLVVTIRKAGRRRSLLERLIVLARAYQVLNDLPSAARTIQEALTIAESHGFLRSILDDGQELQPLLQLALQQNAAPHYITHLLNLISSPQPESGSQAHEPVHDSQMGITYGAMETLGAIIIIITPPIAGILFERDPLIIYPLAIGLISISIVVSYVFLPRGASDVTSQIKQDTSSVPASE